MMDTENEASTAHGPSAELSPKTATLKLPRVYKKKVKKKKNEKMMKIKNNTPPDVVLQYTVI